MSKDPALLVYTKDFLEGTADMSAEEFGAYTRLIFHQHQRGVLPKELKKLARLCLLSLSEFEEVWQEIHAKFTLSDTGYVNKRCAEEIAKRSLSARKKSILAVLGNWVKTNTTMEKCEISAIKKVFAVEDFSGIEDEKLRKEAILKRLNAYAVANAQRSQYANGDVNEDAIVNEDKTETEIVYPFDSETFKTQWGLWKQYKKAEFKFQFKSPITEQASLMALSEKANGNEETAIKIIHQSMENGWKGIFELKPQPNERSNSKSKGKFNTVSDDYVAKIMRGIQPDPVHA
jgi:uncharacterized protein YdaU (DUF1376 family)